VHEADALEFDWAHWRAVVVAAARGCNLPTIFRPLAFRLLAIASTSPTCISCCSESGRAHRGLPAAANTDGSGDARPFVEATSLLEVVPGLPSGPKVWSALVRMQCEARPELAQHPLAAWWQQPLAAAQDFAQRLAALLNAADPRGRIIRAVPKPHTAQFGALALAAAAVLH